MNVIAQRALFHGPGKLSGIQVWRSVAGTRPDHTRALAARILDTLHDEARREGAHCLVALSLRALAGHFAHDALAAELPTPLLPRRGPRGAMPATQGDLFVQVASPDVESGLGLLRRAQRTLETFCWLDVELLGGRIGDGREAFGFRDGLRPPTHEEVERDAIIHEGPARGASWLLYQRWRQDLEAFKRLRESRQADVIGRWPDGREKEDAPNTAHVLVQRAVGDPWPDAKGSGFVRRGFPFRASGNEGLCFVAASRSPHHFVPALDALVGANGEEADALSPYAYAVEGGVYVAPPDSDWLFEREVRASA